MIRRTLTSASLYWSTLIRSRMQTEIRKTLASARAARGPTTAFTKPCLLLDKGPTDRPQFGSGDTFTVYSTLRDFAVQLAEDDLVLFLRPGDEIHEELLGELLRHRSFDAAIDGHRSLL